MAANISKSSMLYDGQQFEVKKTEHAIFALICSAFLLSAIFVNFNPFYAFPDFNFKHLNNIKKN